MKIIFLGTGEIGLPSLKAIYDSSDHHIISVFTQPDKPFGRKGELKPSEIKKFAQSKNIPIYQPEKIREQEAIDQLSLGNPDVLVVVAYGQILPEAVLRIPKIACINLHASLLPLYRGASPIQAAILNGDEQTGLTSMYIAEGLDDGDLLKSKELIIDQDETGGSLHDRLAALGPELLIESLNLLSTGQAPREEQDHDQATHVSKLSRSDGEIDWSKSAELIERKIRAFDPWPGTFTYFPDGTLVKIFPPVSIEKNRDGEPGVIIS
ncbi:MAG: methionyl-tRNA formyltransferase, partial [Verrucomicrobiaceae bacterium]|nr:methionyl-tRNA formyltransferase [Verrucomicrobiaceae bacterium]